MGEQTKIEWATHTLNWWLGCQKISEACASCYAESWAKRSGLVKWGDNPRRLTSEQTRNQVYKWNKAAMQSGLRERVFVNSLSDWAEDREELKPWRAEMFRAIRECPTLDFLLLTKRADKIADFLPEDWGEGYANVWLGVTVENQQRADERIPYLLEVPARIKFLSCEPLLSRIKFGDVPGFNKVSLNLSNWWIICGGESSHKARPMQLTWALDLWRQSRIAHVPFFMKQMSQANWPDYKNFDSFPRDLQVREFPR